MQHLLATYRRGWACWLQLGWLVANLLQTPTVRADGDSEYRQLITEAVAEFQLGQWAEAVVLFRRAHELRPSAKTHRGLGQAYFEARDYVHAIPHLKAALDGPDHVFTPEQRANLERILERSESFVGTLYVERSPAHAALLIDGIPQEDADQPVWLNPGAHTITVTAEGYKNFEQRLQVNGGADLHVQALLSRANARPAAQNQRPTPAPAVHTTAADLRLPQATADAGPSEKAVYRTLGWVSTALAATAFGGAFAVWRMHENGPVADWNNMGCNDVTTPECIDLQEDSESLKRAIPILSIVGGVFTVSAVTMFVLGGGEDPPPHVACGPGALGLHCGGRF